VFWTQSNTTKVGHWLDWNYSGWKSKPLYQQLMALSDELDGDFSDTRVVYEHSVKNAHAGTIRVFEMLPYFTGRATLESVYLQATILAPMAWNIQAYVSKTPSCPFRQFSCPRYDLRAGLPRLYMLGVGDYIAVSEELRTQANILVEEGKLKRGKTFEPWEIFSLTDAPELAAVFDKAPEVISESNWRNAFISWFEEYQEGAAHQVVEGLLSESAIASLHKDSATKSFVWEDRDCRPKLEVDYGRLVLTTPCPGQAHFIRFAYHPAWWADSSDDLFPVSPGFIGLIPSKQTVVLSFGPQPLWILCGAISWIALVVLLFQSYHPCFSQVQRRAIEKPRA
jgi:hypothetical protein